MVLGAIARGLRPMVTLHHFTSPAWFTADGGWTHPEGIARFDRFVDIAADPGDDVAHVCTINEPNMVAIFRHALDGSRVDLSNGLPPADLTLTERLIEAHQAARATLRRNNPGAKTGWSVAMLGIEPFSPQDLDAARFHAAERETRFIEAAAGDDWFGVQAYSRTRVRGTASGPSPMAMPDDAVRTLTGWEYYPAALGNAVRTAAGLLGSVPLIVTENGIATADDAQRIAYTAGALDGLGSAMAEGIRVDGYFHWSLLDNYEWGDFRPTFGLIGVDRHTFERRPSRRLPGWAGSACRAPSGRRRAAERKATGGAPRQSAGLGELAVLAVLAVLGELAVLGGLGGLAAPQHRRRSVAHPAPRARLHQTRGRSPSSWPSSQVSETLIGRRSRRAVPRPAAPPGRRGCGRPTP